MKSYYLLVVILFTLSFIIGCKIDNQKENKNNYVVDKSGKVFVKDTTSMIIRDYTDDDELIIQAIELKNQGNYTFAIKKFDRAEKKYGERLSIYLNRGSCYDFLGKKEEAISDFTKCLDIKEDYLAALLNRGLAYMNLNNYEKALIDLDKAIKVDPTEPACFLNRAVLFRSMGKFEESCRDAKKSIDLGFVEKYNNDQATNIVRRYCN
jgi:tetratricopeptide (TPR) repeat protein